MPRFPNWYLIFQTNKKTTTHLPHQFCPQTSMPPALNFVIIVPIRRRSYQKGRHGRQRRARRQQHRSRLCHQRLLTEGHAGEVPKHRQGETRRVLTYFLSFQIHEIIKISFYFRPFNLTIKIVMNKVHFNFKNIFDNFVQPTGLSRVEWILTKLL